jgi:FkbM family methyltransferase
MIIHIGGHRGQDGFNYEKLGCRKVIWGEANPSFAKLIRRSFPNHAVLEEVFWDNDGEMIDFFEHHEGQNSSAIPAHDISRVKRIVKRTTKKLDTALYGTHLDTSTMLVLDVQGAEYRVLRGATKTLSVAKFVCTEIAIQTQGYIDEPSFEDIYNLLKNFGFRKSINRPSYSHKYVDQLFIKSGFFYICLISLIDKLLQLSILCKHVIVFRHFPTSVFSCSKCLKD